MRAYSKFLSAPAPMAPAPTVADEFAQPSLSTAEVYALQIAIILFIIFFVIIPVGYIFIRCVKQRFAPATASTAASASIAAGSALNTSENIFTTIWLEMEEHKSLPTTITKFSSQSDETSQLAECAICIADFTEGEEVRVLPKCGHGFHVMCIDRWLKSNSTCPLCRLRVPFFLLPAPDEVYESWLRETL